VTLDGVLTGSFFSLMAVLLTDFELAIGELLTALFLLTDEAKAFDFSGLFSIGYGFSCTFLIVLAPVTSTLASDLVVFSSFLTPSSC